MFGLGKPRTRLGRFIDRNDISQEELAASSGMSSRAISELCNGYKAISPNENTMRKIVGALRRQGYDCEFADFWD